MKKAEKNRAKKPVIVKIFLYALLAITIICLLGVIVSACVLYVGNEEIDSEKLTSQSARITVKNAHGAQMALPATYDKNIGKNDVPENVKKAFISLEDKRFYSHKGIDYIRIGGALMHNISAGRMKEGGSTISQQLIKNTHLTSEKSMKRKIEEARLAIQLERQYEKDEILSMYLNVLYFGSGVYGVKNAAKVFFDKEVEELSIAECATLAGIVKSPTKYNPINNYDNCMQRKCVVLDIMLKCGAIESNECENAKKQEIIIKNSSIKNNSAEKYLICAIEECSDILGLTMQQIVYGDYVIDTYMDNNSMNALSAGVGNDAYLIANDKGFKPDAMGIIADNATGGIKAFYSNCDYSPHKTRRQPGSSIKPLACYLPALERGIISPASILIDESTDFNGYSPKNYGGVFMGKVSARQALAKSLNVPAVKLMDTVGIDACCGMLSAMNIQLDNRDYNYSTALGGMTYGTTATELVGGYMMLANGGKYTSLTFINKISDASGKVIYSNNSERLNIATEESAYLLTDMLKSAVKEGTASKLNALQYDIAAKTGTVAYSDNSAYNTDAYCISYTSCDTLMVWQGNLSGKSDKMLSSKVTGGGSPALMSNSVYNKLYSQLDVPMDFALPDNIEQLQIDKFAYDNGEVILASSHAPKKYTVTEIFDKKYFPIMQDTSYDNPCVTSYTLEQDGNKATLNIDANPRLGYKIIKQSFLSRQKEIADFNGSSTNYSISFSINTGVIKDKLIILPYYTDDNGTECYGYPERIELG